MTDTAVIILNWNNQAYLEQFLPSLLQHTPANQATIIIADNGSTDGSQEWLSSHYPDIRIIPLEKNHGFAGGYNRAIEACHHAHLVLLNSDIEVTAGWLSPLLSQLEAPQTAAVMPKIRSFAEPGRFEYAGAAGGFIDRYGYPFCRGRIFDQTEMDHGQYDEAMETHWATGACLVIKRAVFQEAGGFDDDFFAHMEEIDLCWRIRRMGYRIAAEPASQVFHVGGGSLPNESPGKLYLNFRNNLAMLYKNLPDKELRPVIRTRMVLDGLAALVYLVRGKPRFTLAVLKAHRHFYRWKPKLKTFRSQTSIPIPDDPLRSPVSILWQFFIQKKRKFSEL